MNGRRKCLVTGAAGFIGSHLVDQLLEQGMTVVGVDNFKLGRRENLKSALTYSTFKLVELDVNAGQGLSDVLATESAAEPFDMAWHLAANSDIRAGVADPDVDLKDTFLTTFNLLKMGRALGIPAIAFASTSAIYGMHPGLLTEDVGPLFPISNYGVMKLASEAALSAAVEAFLKQAWIFRFPNVVGSRSTHGAIYDFAQKLKRDPRELEVLGDGQQEKPYLHVSELVEAMLFISAHAGEPLNFYNIGPAGSGTSVRYIAEAVVRRQAPEARIRYTGGSKGWVGDVPKFNYSIEKLSRLGWRPRLSSNDAVDRAVAEVVSEVTRS